MAAACQGRVTAADAPPPFLPPPFIEGSSLRPPSPNRAAESRGGEHMFEEGVWDGSRYGCVGFLVFECVAAWECSAAQLKTICTSVHALALLGGGVCPVAGRPSPFDEGRIPSWWRSHSWYGSGGIPGLFQCALLSLEGDSVGVAIYNAALTGSPVLIFADAWSGMIACR